MAAAWQATGTLLGSTGADITPVIPTHQADDILFLVAASRSTTETLTTPSGWTLIEGPIQDTAWRTYAYWKRAASGAETNPLCDWSAATGQKYGVVVTARGCTTSGTPYSGENLNVNLTDPITQGGVGGTTGQTILLIGLGSDNASSSVTVSDVATNAYTQRTFATIATGNDATVTVHTSVAESGSTGTITLDFNSTMPAMGTLSMYLIDEAAPVDADAEVAWAELEVPTANSAAQVSWAELEVPTADSRADVSWAEFEVPSLNADAEVSFTELEVPDTSSSAEISWAEFEVPTAESQAQVSWAELEVPTAQADAEVSWAEFQVSDPDADAEVSFSEFEVPTADSRADISWAEVEFPTANSSAHVSWAEFEVPTAQSAAQVGWTSVEIPDPSGGGGGESYMDDDHPTVHSY